jgi:Fe2+ transport system protein FeoA
LSRLRPGAIGRVHDVLPDGSDLASRLLALGVTRGAPITILQTTPCVVFRCDQTELAVEHLVADAIFIEISEE